jgi:PAS domain-containing protein
MDTSRNVRHLNRLPALPWSRARPLATIVELQNLNQPLPTTTALFAHMADAVYLLDPDTSNIIWGNRAAWESLGLSCERGAQPQRAQPADGRDRCAALERDRRRDPQRPSATPSSAATGTRWGTRWRLRSTPPASQTSGREFFLSVARDISRRMALEADLKKRENQLWFALNEAMDGLWDWEIA